LNSAICQLTAILVIEPGEVVLDLIPKIDELLKNYSEDKGKLSAPTLQSMLRWICLTKLKNNRKEYY
jgi:hypothetical protein